MQKLKKSQEMSGQRFGRLLVDAYEGKTAGGRARWRCSCDCGCSIIVSRGALLQGHSRSCGCLRREVTRKRRTTHGLSHTREYHIWKGIRKRCLNPKTLTWKYYGGRGIHICPQWSNFSVFLLDMGPCPSLRHSIDRVNNEGHYEPSNCQWATQREQVANRRNQPPRNTSAVALAVSDV